MNWISVKDKLPPAEKRVILHQYVNDIRQVQIYGFYAPKNTIEYEGDDEFGFVADYDEARDKFYIPQGFYELVENWGDLCFLAISDRITHWREIPESPKPEEL